MFRTVSLTIIRSLALYAQQYVKVIQVFADCLLAISQQNLHPESYSKNKFEKLVLLVGVTIRIQVYHDITMHGPQNVKYVLRLRDTHRDSFTFTCYIIP